MEPCCQTGFDSPTRKSGRCTSHECSQNALVGPAGPATASEAWSKAERQKLAQVGHIYIAIRATEDMFLLWGNAQQLVNDALSTHHICG